MTRILSPEDVKKFYRHVVPDTGACTRKGVICPQWLEFKPPTRRVEQVGIDSRQEVTHPTRVYFRDDTIVIACRYCRLDRVS